MTGFVYSDCMMQMHECVINDVVIYYHRFICIPSYRKNRKDD